MNNGKYTVFGLKKGDPVWAESLLCDTDKKEIFERCMNEAQKYGYEITRIYKPETKLNEPDFVGCVNV